MTTWPWARSLERHGLTWRSLERQGEFAISEKSVDGAHQSQPLRTTCCLAVDCWIHLESFCVVTVGTIEFLNGGSCRTCPRRSFVRCSPWNTWPTALERGLLRPLYKCIVWGQLVQAHVLFLISRLPALHFCPLSGLEAWGVMWTFGMHRQVWALRQAGASRCMVGTCWDCAQQVAVLSK